MYDLKDKAVVVTGAASGIGASFVREILEEGVKHVRLLDIDKKSGQALQDELREKYGKNKVKFVKCDVTDDGEFFKALEDAKKDNVYLDLLVNNAGVAEENNYAKIRKLIEINVTALINGTLKAIELMRKDKGGRGGAIINVASIGGLIPVSPMFTYSTSKRATIQFSILLGAKSVARGMVEMYQKGGPASTWLVRADKPAQDITAELDKADEEIEAVIREAY